MQGLSHFSSVTTAHPLADLSGTYTALVGDSECVFRLWWDDSGAVRGIFVAEGETLVVRGGISGRMGSIYGFLMEEASGTPVAVFRATLEGAGLVLQVDVPDFDELLDLCNLEHIAMSKVGEIRLEVNGESVGGGL